MICPLMSYAANQTPCVKEGCGFWDAREECCAVLSSPRRIQDSVRDLVDVLNDIKVRF